MFFINVVVDKGPLHPTVDRRGALVFAAVWCATLGEINVIKSNCLARPILDLAAIYPHITPRYPLRLMSGREPRVVFIYFDLGKWAPLLDKSFRVK